MASEASGADLVGFIIGLILFGAMIQMAMSQLNKITGIPIPEGTPVAQEAPQTGYEIPVATSTKI